MLETIFTKEVVMALVAAIISGIGWLVKHWWNRKEEERKTEMEERNKRREAIEDRLTKVEKDSKMFQSMILSCEHPDCQVKKALADYFKKDL